MSPHILQSGPAPEHPVKPGQVWASTHRGDIDAGVRQHREVLRVWFEMDLMERVTIYASVQSVTRKGVRREPQRVKCTGKSIKGHRLVRDPGAGQKRKGD